MLGLGMPAGAAVRDDTDVLQAKLDAGHERFLAMVRELRETKEREGQDAGHSGGH